MCYSLPLGLNDSRDLNILLSLSKNNGSAAIEVASTLGGYHYLCW